MRGSSHRDCAAKIRELERRIVALERPKSPQRTSWERRDAALREAAAQVWRYLFREPWPDGLDVHWVPHLRRKDGELLGNAHVGGWTGGAIRLSWSALLVHPNPLAVLVHEIGHSRGLDHGKEFRARVDKWIAKLGGEPGCDE